MASTSTNKQPLLVDSVMHNVVDTSDAYVTGLAIDGTNSAALLVLGSGTDGAIIEDVYAISRDTSQHKFHLYLSPSQDYLRPTEGMLVGSFATPNPATAGAVTHHEDMPYVLAPVPQTGTEKQFKALYVPRNMNLWVAREGNAPVATAPLVGVQGGWY
jgi:hypothetical protein